MTTIAFLLAAIALWELARAHTLKRYRQHVRRYRRRHATPYRSRAGIDRPPRITEADLDLAYEQGVQKGMVTERNAQKLFDEGISSQ